MTYTLRRLASGSFDILLDDELVGGLVRNVSANGRVQGWQAELLTEAVVTYPIPFTQTEHVFPTRDAALTWLSIPTRHRRSPQPQNVTKV